MGLLPPARIDPESGYRYYSADQLDDARLIARLRQLGMPLPRIACVLQLEGPAAAREIAEY